MDENSEKNISNIFKPLEPKIYMEKFAENSDIINKQQINNFSYKKMDKELNSDINKNLNLNTNNIFGLNFHQDEEDNENEIINSLHFSKFNMNNGNYINENNKNINNNLNNYNANNNFEQKIKNNRKMLSNNINLNINNCPKNEEEPFQISVSKYTESNYDNSSIFNNSKINTNNNNKQKIDTKINNDLNNNHKMSKKKTSNKKIYKNLNFNYQTYNNEVQKLHPNYIKHNLILNNNYYINNNNSNSNINNTNDEPVIVRTNSFSSNRIKISDKKVNNHENYNHLNNYYKIPKNKLKKKKDDIKTTNTFVKEEINKKNNIIFNHQINKTKNSTHKKHYSNSNFSVRTPTNLNLNKLIKNNNFTYMNENFIEENFKKIYTKQQKAELDMVRGCYIYDKKYSNFDIKNGSKVINFIKFIKPTEPILQINYNKVDKFYPLIRKKFAKDINNINIDNNILNNIQMPQKEKESLTNENLEKMENNNPSQKRYKNIRFNKLIKHNKIPKKMPNVSSKKNLTFDFENQKIDTNLNVNTFTENINPKIDKDGIPKSLKKKIYDWLIDIDIIKDKIIKIDSLPTLCINGVLLCDLINRCEGKNEIIKGIIRRTNTRSQIQVNINKVLEYLRTIEKFPSRNLWNNIEISKGNSLIIWQILDDIYNFYGNKITFKKKNKKGNNNNSFSNDNNYLNKTFTNSKNNLQNFDINIINQLDDNEKIYKNMTTNNSKNDAKIYLDNKKNCNTNYSKYTYTPDEYSSNIQKRKKLLNDNLFEKYNEINNNDNFIYDNSKKLNKKRKANNNAINKYPHIISTNSSNRNNLNHTNDNFYESKMFSLETSIEEKTNRPTNKYTKINKNNNINNKIFQKNFDISSISSDKNFNQQKNNKSFSVNNGAFNNNRKNKKFNINNKNICFSRYADNQSFYSTNLEGNRKNKGCFLLFEKSSINRLKEKIGNINKYNVNNLDTLDIKDI